MRKHLILAALTVFCLSCGVASATTFDLARDFSVERNPNGAWSYGWSASRGSDFILDTQTFEGYSYGIVRAWQAPNFEGALYHIAYAVTQVNHPTVNIPAGTVNFHPGPRGENSVIRWTAPTTGRYRIEGLFTGNDFAYPTTTDVAILHGSTEIFSDAINSYRVPTFFSLVEQVKAGETIDFTVGFGNGAYWGDSTGVEAVIREEVLEVGIDIKPGDFPNSVNANGKGAIPVAIFGSPDFNVRKVNPKTLLLENMPVKANSAGKLLAHYDDVNDDGIEDLLVQIEDTGKIAAGTTTATLIGNLFDSTPIKGSDSISLVP